MLGIGHYDGLATWCRAIRHGHGAGLTLVRVFEMQARSGPLALRDSAARIARRLESGDSLEDSLVAEGHNLPELLTSLAAVGERSGRIPEIFRQLEDYYRLQGQIRRQFRAQASWPIFQFIAAVVVIALAIFLIGFLAPSDQEPIAPIGLGLTGTSGALIFVAAVGVFVAGILIAIKLATKNVAKQADFEARLLQWPVIGPCIQALAMSRFCLALQVTLDSSMSTAKAVRLSLRAASNAAFEAQADQIAKHIKKGDNLAKAFRKSGIFPVEFVAAVNVGEESGQIPEVMAKQGEYYREETARRMRALSRIMGWGIYILVGIFIIIAIFRMANVYLQATGAA